MTAVDWAEYQAADAVGLIPDWRRQQELLACAAGIDPIDLFDEREQQDMSALYQQRKAVYGGNS